MIDAIDHRRDGRVECDNIGSVSITIQYQSQTVRARGGAGGGPPRRDFGYYCAPSSLPSKMTQVARHRAARLRLTTSGRGGLISISLSSLFFSDPRFHELIRLQQRRCSAIPIHSAAAAAVAAAAAAMIFSISPDRSTIR